MPPRDNPRRAARLRWTRLRRVCLLTAAALPLCQITCYPDLLGAFNFELQRFINSTLINAVDIVVRNLLRL
jgi:hypothetical protein